MERKGFLFTMQKSLKYYNDFLCLDYKTTENATSIYGQTVKAPKNLFDGSKNNLF